MQFMLLSTKYNSPLNLQYEPSLIKLKSFKIHKKIKIKLILFTSYIRTSSDAIEQKSIVVSCKFGAKWNKIQIILICEVKNVKILIILIYDIFLMALI
jgi:hypothetical protein